MMLSDVCLSVAYIGPKSITEKTMEDQNWHRGRPRHTWLWHHFKIQRSRSPGHFTQPDVYASAAVTVGTYCYVAVRSTARGASAPTEGGEGRGILWRLPHSLFYSVLYFYLFSWTCFTLRRAKYD